MWATLFCQCGGYCGRGGHGGLGGCGRHGGHSGDGGSSGTGESHESMWSYCKIYSHMSDICRKRQCAEEGGNTGWTNNRIHFHCGLQCHGKVNCISSKRIKEWWTVRKATATADLAATGDHDPFWPTAGGLAATAEAPEWVIHSGVSHNMCNDHSSLSRFIKLSLPIVIEFGDINSVTSMYYVFVDVIQGYQVEAFHTPTFRISLLRINQLHFGRHTTIFLNGKCSITSPSSSSFAGNEINPIYITVPTTTVLSSTTKIGKRRNRDCSPPVEPTIESTIESSIAHITAKTLSTRKSLTITESRIWHWWLAHMNPAAIKSLVKGYTNNESMCTVCIQAKYKQRFIKLQVKRTTKPFQLVHSDMCGPFFTPTFVDSLYYILSIDGYTRYTSIWLLPNYIAETFTYAYRSFHTRVGSMGYEIKRFRCNNWQAKFDIETFWYVLVAHGPTYQPCPPYAHHKTGVAECMMHIFTEMARAMMIDSQAPVQFWGEAVDTTVYLHER